MDYICVVCLCVSICQCISFVLVFFCACVPNIMYTDMSLCTCAPATYRVLSKADDVEYVTETDYTYQWY